MEKNGQFFTPTLMSIRRPSQRGTSTSCCCEHIDTSTFRKVGQKLASGQVGNSVLLQIYLGICMPKIVNIEHGLTTLLLNILAYSVVYTSIVVVNCCSLSMYVQCSSTHCAFLILLFLNYSLHCIFWLCKSRMLAWHSAVSERSECGLQKKNPEPNRKMWHTAS